MVERQRTIPQPAFCLHCPPTQVWESDEEMDGDNVKKAGVALVTVFGNGETERDFEDERRKPWTRVEELAGCLELLHRPDDKAAEETDSRPGYKRDAREREIA